MQQRRILAAIDRVTHGREVDRQALGLCVAEGWRLIERALAAGLTIEAVAVARAVEETPTRDESRAVASLRSHGVDVVAVDDAELSRRIDGRTFGRLLALVQRQRDPVESLLQQPGRLVVLERVLDPGNIGAIARSAAALGAAGLIVVEGCDPLHGKALRTSMGALWRLPVARWPEKAPALVTAARSLGRPSLAAWLGGARLSLFRTQDQEFNTAGALLWMGSEAHGLRPETAAACDLRLQIDMEGDDGGVSVDSLSVAAAAAVLLWATRPL